MATYTVKEFKPWQGEGGEVKDDYGNVMGSLVLEGHGEPVDGRFKTPPEAGSTLEGEIIEYQTKSGSTRTKFKREQAQFKGGGRQVDPRTMYVAYAKDVWIAMNESGEVDSVAYKAALEQIKGGGELLM